jgi:hypothetical protein
MNRKLGGQSEQKKGEKNFSVLFAERKNYQNFNESNYLRMICVACNNTKSNDADLKLDGINLEMFNFVCCLELTEV